MIYTISKNYYIRPFFSKKVPAIVFTIDDNYYGPASVVLESLIVFTNPREKYDIVILYSNLTDIQQEIIKMRYKAFDNISIRFFNMDNILCAEYDNLFVSRVSHINHVAFYRLFIPTLFSLYKKVVFLDSDILLNTDISQLFQIKMKNNYVAAVPDAGARTYGPCISKYLFEFARYTYEVLNVPLTNYFNAGVLLLNIKQINKDYKSLEFFNVLKENSYLMYNDQCVLNKVFSGKVFYLSPDWNYFANDFATINRKLYDEITDFPIKIYHFVGKNKPWLSTDHPYYPLFKKYQERIEKIRDRKG